MMKHLFHYQITMLGSHNKVKQMLATVTSYGDGNIEHLCIQFAAHMFLFVFFTQHI